MSGADHDKLREAIKHVVGGVYFDHNCEQCRLVALAAEAHLATLPKTKMVEVWRTEYAEGGKPYAGQFHTKEDADHYARTLARWPKIACIRVTGPHMQEVPA